MKSLLTTFSCFISLILFSQNTAPTVQVVLANPPTESVAGTLSFFSNTEVQEFPITFNNGSSLNVYSDPFIDWNFGLVNLDDCNGNLISEFFYRSDSVSFYYVVLNYCESDSVFGCTDSEALNYMPEANVDDGSCIYEGAANDLCVNAMALEEGTILIDNTYTPENEGIFGECWNFGSGEGEQSSLWFSFTTPSEPAEIHIEAINDQSWTLTDTQFGLFTECGGEMIYCDGNSGEGLLSAFDFSCGELDTNTTYILMVDGWNGDVGTCFLNFEISAPCDTEVLGCTDPEAINYNPSATVNDGSCEYEECENNSVVILINTENWGYEISWNIRNEAGEEVAGSGNYPDYSTITELACLEDGCYDFELFDSFGDGWNGGTFEILLNDTILASGTLETGEFASIPFGVNADGCGENEISGCTDPQATNYNPEATIDDGTCQYVCSDVLIGFDFFSGAPADSSYMNTMWTITNEYDSIVFSGSWNSWSPQFNLCLEDGCYTYTLFNVSPEWDGIYNVVTSNQVVSSGTFTGENDTFEFHFGVNEDGCEGAEDIFGCTDPEASNYNPSATIDDGSCEYLECDNNEIIILINTENWGYEISWNIRNEEGDEVAGSGDYPNYSTITELACLEDGCYSFELFDSFGDGWNGATFDILLNDSILASGTLEAGEFASIPFGVNADGCGENEISGCTDPSAINYNPEATIDDGSCEYDFECGISFEVIADSLGENMFYIIPSDNIVNASSVLWDFGDGSTSTEFYPTHIYESDGPFTLCLFVTFEDDNGNYCEISYCEVLDGTLFGGPGVLSGGFMINVIPTGTLSDNSSIAETEISVYPNPTNDIATISYLSDRSEKLTLRISDLTGKVLEQRVLSSSIGQQKIQVDLSEFPQGLYLIGLEQNESRTYAKVVRR